MTTDEMFLYHKVWVPKKRKMCTDVLFAGNVPTM